YVAASRAEKYKMTPQATEDEPGILRCYDNTLFLEAIEEADENADYVIALPHWGTEYSTELEDAQTEGAKEYIDAGADAVIGAHTHCLQGIGSYNDKPIVYSLGNFWFNEKTLETMLYEIHLTIEKTTDESGESTSKIISVETEIIPGMQEDYTTAPAKTEDEKEDLLNYIYSLPTE
ncbi:MAG: CapA family protein, partial [Eubacterium sp.]|nr:CapA family protein [Eubacterium sp.]